MSSGFNSPGVRVRLPGAPGGKKVRSGKSDWVGSPERSRSSPDCLIAGMRIIQKRGIFLRGNYDSANNMGQSHPAWGGHIRRRGRFPRRAKGVQDPAAPFFRSVLHPSRVLPSFLFGERSSLRRWAFFAFTVAHRSSPSPTVRHRVGYGSATHRHILSSSYTFPIITGENTALPPGFQNLK